MMLEMLDINEPVEVADYLKGLGIPILSVSVPDCQIILSESPKIVIHVGIGYFSLSYIEDVNNFICFEACHDIDDIVVQYRGLEEKLSKK